ncbi:putative fungistatic metabolite [Echria macrotheca]|uniref:Fungistatic metabolite n=1 Tax=Echria macrotheca TaxID=438768 RepID=A0AAJ0B8F0_9PEZI|nr:putative fungistatic metabolite [Echria macrotheca]
MLALLTLAVLPAALAQTFYYYGCYTEPSGVRALSSASYVSSTSMSPSDCQTYCTGLGYTLWGVEYSSECYCASALSQGSFASFSTDCSMPCLGNPALVCGGPDRLSLYGTSPTTPAVTPLPYPSPRPTSTRYVDCYNEGTGVRALAGRAAVSSGMTVSGCGQFCLDSGFTMFGLEYYDECYCGDSVNSTVASSGSECNTACMGDAGQTCGGPDRLSVWEWY